MSKRVVVAGMVLLMVVASRPPEAKAQDTDTARVRTAASVALIYQREVYTYRGNDRRDPFRPLTDDDSMGPQFESLSLQGIIYSSAPGNSMALLADSEGRVYRVRVGDRIGNTRVIEISQTRVILAVENFGSVRQEMLELPTRGGSP